MPKCDRRDGRSIERYDHAPVVIVKMNERMSSFSISRGEGEVDLLVIAVLILIGWLCFTLFQTFTKPKSDDDDDDDLEEADDSAPTRISTRTSASSRSHGYVPTSHTTVHMM